MSDRYARIEASREARGAWAANAPQAAAPAASERPPRYYVDTKWALVEMNQDGRSFRIVRDRLSYHAASMLAARAGGRHQALRLRKGTRGQPAAAPE